MKSNFNFPSDKLSFKEQNFSKQTLLDIKKYDVIDKIKSDPRIESILRKHTSFLKIKPLSPISTSPERVNISHLSTSIDLIQKIHHLRYRNYQKIPEFNQNLYFIRKFFLLERRIQICIVTIMKIFLLRSHVLSVSVKIIMVMNIYIQI